MCSNLLSLSEQVVDLNRSTPVKILTHFSPWSYCCCSLHPPNLLSFLSEQLVFFSRGTLFKTLSTFFRALLFRSLHPPNLLSFLSEQLVYRDQVPLLADVIGAGMRSITDQVSREGLKGYDMCARSVGDGLGVADSTSGFAAAMILNKCCWCSA